MSSVVDTHVDSRIAENSDGVELSVVMPCLNEAATVGICVKKALDALKWHGIRGEVIVADNGSTDGSQQIARDLARASCRWNSAATEARYNAGSLRRTESSS